MPVYVRTDRSGLCLILSSQNQIVDTQFAATSQEANRAGIMMLASRDSFDAGDTLVCFQADMPSE
jgi:hypothetical protein